MTYKKKQAIPSNGQFNKLISEPPENERRLKPRLDLEMIF